MNYVTKGVGLRFLNPCKKLCRICDKNYPRIRAGTAGPGSAPSPRLAQHLREAAYAGTAIVSQYALYAYAALASAQAAMKTVLPLSHKRHEDLIRYLEDNASILLPLTMSAPDGDQLGNLGCDYSHRVFRRVQTASRSEHGANVAERCIGRSMHDRHEPVTLE